jgi:integrase
MGRIFKKTRKKPLPGDAEIITRRGKRLAQWRDPKGKKRTAPVSEDSASIMVEAAVYSMRFRDAAGIIKERSTKCRTRDAAESVLRETERMADMVKSGIMSADEVEARNWAGKSLAEHLSAWIDTLRGRGRTERHCRDMRFKTERLFEECRFLRLQDINRGKVERWLAKQFEDGMPPRTRNGYLGAALNFCNWAVREGRMANNPLQGIEKSNIQLDRRRVRRALSEDEFRRLCDAARERPLHDATHKNRGPKAAQLSKGTTERLSFLGEERAMIYITLATTGLRKSELRSIRLCDAHLDGPSPFLELRAESEKNRKGSKIPLKRDLAEQLTQHVTERLNIQQRRAQRSKRLIPVNLGAHSPLLPVPDALIKVFRRDMAHAGIPEKDARGRVADVHSLRMFFGSHLARAGVPLRTIQELMRHSDPKLTARIYQDVGLLDTAGAVESLPSFLTANNTGQKEAKAAHAGESAPPPCPPIRPPKDGKSVPFSAIPGNTPSLQPTAPSVPADTKKAPHLQGFSASGNAGQECKNGSGARIRTADTWIMIPLL